MIRCDTANYKPASRGAESLSKETFLENLIHIHSNTDAQNYTRWLHTLSLEDKSRSIMSLCLQQYAFSAAVSPSYY